MRQNYYNRIHEDDDEPKPLPDSVIELTELLDDLLENPPRDKRKRREVDEWRKKVNELVHIINNRTGFKMYKVIK